MSAPAQADTPTDLDKVYRPELTGRDIEGIGVALDALVRAGGLQTALHVVPLFEKIAAPRLASVKGKKA